ncbi:2-oxoglutarate-dependent dioxygenase DAO [Linum perenne]
MPPPQTPLKKNDSDKLHKQRNKDAIPESGYLAPTTTNPLYEALGLYNVGSNEAVEEFCDQLEIFSPQRSEISQTHSLSILIRGGGRGFKDTIHEYAKKIHRVAMQVATRITESFGVGEEVDSFQLWPCTFRINKYHFQPETIGSSGIQIHTDSSFLTILQEDESVGGLEVMNPSDEHYIPTPVEVPATFVDDEHPRMYRPISYNELRILRLSTKLQAGDVLELLRDPRPSEP